MEHIKTTSKSIYLSKTISFSNLIIGVFLANTTLVYSIPFQILLQVSHRRRNQLNFVHQQRRGAQLLISCIINLALWEC